jgi:hypothetical protein
VTKEEYILKEEYQQYFNKWQEHYILSIISWTLHQTEEMELTSMMHYSVSSPKIRPRTASSGVSPI